MAVAGNDDKSSMLQAKWSGSTAGGAIVYGQAEGVSVHHGYPLPPNFRGELQLVFYTEIGQYQFDPANYGTDDFVFLDNLRLRTHFTETSEAPAPPSVQIRPNPARTQVAISSAHPIRAVSLHSANGQVLRRATVAAQRYDLDLFGLENGFYLLKVELENGEWVVQKLVKME